MSGIADGVKKRSTAPLWIMVAIFAAPFLAALFFFYNPQYLPVGKTNKGEIIEPAVPLPPELGLYTPEGQELDRKPLEQKWTLVYVAGGDCGEHCLDRLIEIRQIRLALGEGQLSVERLLIMTDPAAKELAAELGKRFEGMQVALTDTADGAELLDLLGEGTAALDRIYILDPMGNLAMRYASNAPADDTLKDMELLLKATKDWIKGGQFRHE